MTFYPIQEYERKIKKKNVTYIPNCIEYMLDIEDIEDIEDNKNIKANKEIENVE
jgi:hypothetical protein